MNKFALYIMCFLAFAIGYVAVNWIFLGRDFELDKAVFVGMITSLLLLFVLWIPLIKKREARNQSNNDDVNE